MIGHADIWRIDLSQFAIVAPVLMNTLNKEEQYRADRLLSEVIRNRFIASRILLRHILSKYTNQLPQKIEFDYGIDGKPKLKKDFYCNFNISHSDDHAALIVHDSAEVGIDIEHIKPINCLSTMVGNCLTSYELNDWHKLKEDEKLSGFYRHWVRKEAFLKASGHGLTISMNEVSFNKNSMLSDAPEILNAFKNYKVWDIQLDSEVYGAFAAPQKTILRQFNCINLTDIAQ